MTDLAVTRILAHSLAARYRSQAANAPIKQRNDAMSEFEKSVSRHYGFADIMRQIRRSLDRAGKPIDQLTLDDLAPVDAFHTRGRESTVELAALHRPKPSSEVLDVGCGLGGSARYLADRFGCSVTGVDVTEQYLEAARQLTELTGLADRITYTQASAVQLPFDEETFDIVWTEHAQMNIADKERLYSEIARVLKPGGSLLFHDIFAGAGVPVYPLPWADDLSISCLATCAEVRQGMEQGGLEIDQWSDKSASSLEFFEQVLAKIEAEGLPPVGIHLLMGDTARPKIANYVDGLQRGCLVVAMGLARKPA